jgi:hypothetical protein
MSRGDSYNFAERDEAGFYGESGEDFLRLSEIEGRFAPVHGGPSFAMSPLRFIAES